MNKTIKTLTMAALAAFTFGFTTSAQAEDSIKVEIPGRETKYYPSFAEAWEVATNGTAQAPARLTLESDNVEMVQRQSVPAGAVITIDLYGNALICANGGGIVNNGTLTIADSEFGTGAWHHYFTKVESPVMHWVLSQEETEYAVDGGVLTGVNASGDSGGAIVNNGTLILEGGSIAGNTVSDTTKYTYGGAICNNGSFTMQNGVICYNAGYQGAAIANMSGGSVVMTGGFIRSNITRNTGSGSAGLYNAAGATANLTGGSIMDNTGIGVWQESATSDSLVLGGTIVIESGVSGVPGLYLNSEDALALISTTVPLASGAHIGVTTRNNPTSDEPVKFTSNGATGDVQYFYSDAGYTVEKLDGQDGLWLTYQAGGGYITFKCEYGEFTLTAAKTWNGTLRYSTDAENWKTWEGGSISSGASVEDYQVLYIGGEVGITNITGAGASPWVIESNGYPVSCEGNIETLRGASGNAPSPTQMAEHCYENMFSNCTSLTSTPKLPATSIAMYCYYGMFRGCTSLTRVPALPSLGGAEYAYESMFENCSGIKLYYPGKGVESWSVGVSQSKDPDMWGKDMFKGTGGTLQGAPKTGRTYYYEWAPGYEITTVTAGEGTGTLETDPSGTVAAGEIIRVTAAPSGGSQLDSLEAYYTDDQTQVVTIKNNQFTMPETNVTVKATFQKGGSGYAITVVKNPDEGGEVTGMPASAEQGTSVEFTVTANTAAGYSIGEVTAVGASGPIEVKGSKGKYSFTMPGEDVTVTATFTQSPTPTEKHKINIDSGVTGGTVSTEPAGEAAEGDAVTLIATPASGYTLVSKGYSDSSGYQEVTGDSFTMPGEDVTVTATFTPVTPSEYTITIDGGITGGTVTSVAKAAAGVRVVLMVTPDSKKQLGSLIVTSPLSVDPISLENNTFLMPAADVTVTAEFADPKTDPATITGYVSEGGKVTPSVETAAKGTTVTLVIAPAKGYALTSLTFVDIDGEHYAPTKTGEKEYVLAMPIRDVTAEAAFAHAITVVKSPTEGGNVDKMPAGAEAGTTVNFTVTANDGYSIGEVTAKSGGEVVEVTPGSKGSYSFTMPDGAVDVTVTFTGGPTPTEKHKINIDSGVTGGTVSTEPAGEAAEGDTVKLIATPASGYTLVSKGYSDSSGYQEVTGDSFTMPGEDVTVTATFKGGSTPHKIIINKPTGEGEVTASSEAAVAGTLVALTVTPGSERMLVSLKVVDGMGMSVPVENNTFEMPDADVYVSSEFGETKGMFKIIGCEAVGGAVLPSPESASFGTTVTLTVKPESGYQLDTMTVMGDSKKVYTPTKTGDTTYVLAMPDEGITVTATFKGGSTPHKIIINKPTGDGTVTAPSEAVAGTLVTLTVTPGSGMMLASLYVEDGKKVSVPVENNTFVMPDADVYVSSEFVETKGMFKIMVEESKGGSVAPDPAAATPGTTVTLAVKPEEGYQLDTLTVMGEGKKEYTPTKTGDTTYVLAMPDEGITVTATFIPGTTGYAITYCSKPEAGGTVSGPESAEAKTAVNFTVTANKGYVIDTVTAQTKAGTDVPVLGSAGAYSFEMPGEAVDVTATFAEAPPPEFGDYLTFASDGSFTLATANATKGWDGTLQYSIDAESWTEWDGTTPLTAKMGESGGYVLYVRGDNYNTKIVGDSEGKWVLTPAGENKIACLGNIEALRGATGDAPSPTPMGNTCYSHMFRGCQVLTTAPALPATTLANNCYESMFRDCTALTNAPALPATTLTARCYDYMFKGCTSLTTAPALPAMTLTQECYLNMFYECTSLKTAPELPAMTLGDSCYSGMFQGCTALTNAPALPATTLPEECCIGMFAGCTSLEAPAMMNHVTTIGKDSCSGMYYGCANLVVNTTSSKGYAKPWVVNATSVGSCWNEGMFTETAGSFKGDPVIGTTYYIKGEGPKFGDYLTFSSDGSFTLATTNTVKTWDGTLQYSTDAAEWTEWDGTTTLTAKESKLGGYFLYMRGNDQNTKIAGSDYDNWVLTPSGENKIACLGNIETLRGATGDAPSPTPMTVSCYGNMFLNCTALTNAPALPATTLSVHCYLQMFQGCTSLTAAPALPAMTLVDRCYSSMFEGCTSLTAAPELPAMTLKEECYSGMFCGCTSLTTIPGLPATTLAQGCYSGMFEGCTSLTTAPELPATTLPANCYMWMFSGCTSLEAPAMMDHVTTIGNESCCSMYGGSKLSPACVSLVVNKEPTEGYTKPWVVNATSVGSYWNDGMFDGTAGTFTGNPVIGTTYYIKSEGPTPPPKGDYIAFSSGDGFSVAMVQVGSAPSVTNKLEYSTDATNWTAWDLTAKDAAESSEVGYVLYVRGTGIQSFSTSDYGNYSYFVLTPSGANKIACSGNIETLLDYATVAGGAHPTMGDRAYQHLFYNCTALTSGPELPSDTTTQACYANLFQGCTSLTTAPALPATTLAWSCYNSMFKGCTALTAAPALPATTLAGACYQHMFEGCTALTRLPEISVDSLPSECCSYMFYECTGIMLSETGTEDTWQVTFTPSGIEPSGDWNVNMLAATGGSFTGEPAYNTDYYYQYKVTVDKTGEGTVTVSDKATVGENMTVTLAPASGWAFESIDAYKTDEPETKVTLTPVTEGEEYTFTMPTYGVTVAAVFQKAMPSVSYLEPVYNTPGDPKSGIQEWQNLSVDDYTVVTSATSAVTWGTAGTTSWYVVKDSELQIDGGVTCAGNVNLILVDGASLTITNVAANAAGIATDPSGSFTVYGQPDGAGALTVTGGQNGAGIGSGMSGAGSNITVNGGTVTATGLYGAGIGGGANGKGSNITVNGGTVTATGGTYGAGIGGGCEGAATDITINGGTVTAMGSSGGAGIGGGRWEVGKNITLNGGTVLVYTTETADCIGSGSDGAAASGVVVDSSAKVFFNLANQTMPEYFEGMTIMTPETQVATNRVLVGGCAEWTAATTFNLTTNATEGATGTITVNDGFGTAFAHRLLKLPYADNTLSLWAGEDPHVEGAVAKVVIGAEANEYKTIGEAWSKALEGTTANPATLLLLTNVTTTSTLTLGMDPSGGATVMTLDLNGYMLQKTGEDQSVIRNEGGELTVTDRRFEEYSCAHNFRKDEQGFWVPVEEGWNYTVYGGVITGGRATTGGGIYNDSGTLRIERGHIAGNAAQTGGGIYNNANLFVSGGSLQINTGAYGAGICNGATVYLYGGSLWNNEGIGIAHQGENLVVGGSLAVERNPTNLYLTAGKTMQISAESPLSNVARINVRTATAPTSEAPVAITSNGKESDKAFFTSDEGYDVTFDQGQLYLTVPPPPNGYITFVSSGGGFTLGTTGKGWDGALQYSTDQVNWTVWDGSPIAAVASMEGGYVLYVGGGTNVTTVSSGDKHWTLTPDGAYKIHCSGNIETLRGATGDDPSPTPMWTGCYAHLFQDCASLASAPQLTATNLSSYCYYGMFEGCVSLTEAPALPANDLPNNCYATMFEGCVSLTQLPAIAVTNLSPSCCGLMFKSCTGIALQTEDAERGNWLVELTGGAEPGEYWNGEMLVGTGGAFTDDPAVNTTYYYGVPARPIIVEKTGYGTVTVAERAREGNPVEVTVEPDYGWRLGEISARGRISGDPVIMEGEGTSYSFTMPSEEVVLTVVFVELPPFCDNCLAFTSESAFSLSIDRDEGAPTVTLEWSFDRRVWTALDVGTPQPAAEEEGNYYIYLRGTNNTAFATKSAEGDILANHLVILDTEGMVECGNDYFYNIETLLDWVALSKGNHPAIGEYAFARLFENNVHLSAKSLFFGMGGSDPILLTTGCCEGMFQGCAGMTRLPSLASTNLVQDCYKDMFRGCTGITLYRHEGGADSWYISSDAQPETPETNWGTNMLAETGGRFQGTPVLGKYYYYDPDTSYYAIEVDPGITHGSVDPSGTLVAQEGNQIGLYVYPDQGYELTSLTVYNTDDPTQTVEVLFDEEYERYFMMPAFDVTITATFEPGGPIATVTIGKNEVTYTDLQEAWTAACAGTKNNPATLKLLRNAQANGTLYVQAGESGTAVYMTLDLDGWVLSEDPEAEGFTLIDVDEECSLKVTDSRFGDESLPHYFEPYEDATKGPYTFWRLSETETDYVVYGGLITGGHKEGDDVDGAAIYNTGSLTIESGNIAGNRVVGTSADGGAIATGHGGTFSMTGGEICYNVASTGGGGICIYEDSGASEISGGKIHHNNSAAGGGVAVSVGSTLTVSGGEICYNQAVYLSEEPQSSGVGGGLAVVKESAVANVTGGTIYNNSANGLGGFGGAGIVNVGELTMTGGTVTNNTGVGVMQVGVSLTLGGTTVVDQNTSANLVLLSGKTISVGDFGSGAHIGVATQTKPAAGESIQLSAECDETDLAYFSSDYPDCRVEYMFNEETASYTLYLTGLKVSDISFHFEEPPHGSMTSVPEGSAAEGTIVQLIDTPDEGYHLDSVMVVTEDGDEIPVVNNRFTMPNLNVDVQPKFAEGADYVASVTIRNEAGEIETTKYTTIEAAWAAALWGEENNPATLTLLKDIALTGSPLENYDSVMTLDLNGHRLQRTTGAQRVIMNAGVLTIVDSPDPGGAEVHTYFEQDWQTGLWTIADKTTPYYVTGGLITGGNVSSGYGGAILNMGTLTLEAGNIAANRGTNLAGGAIACNKGATFTMTGGEICFNDATMGGGVHMVGTSDAAELSGGKIHHNRAMSGGGVSGGAGSHVTVTNYVEISYNTAYRVSGQELSGKGGGLAVLPGGELSIGGGTITGNEARYGGGVASVGSVLMTGGAITENTAVRGGGIANLGIMSGATAVLTIEGGTIMANTCDSTEKAGAGIFNFIDSEECQAEMMLMGGGIYANYGPSVVHMGSSAIVGGSVVIAGEAESQSPGLALPKGMTVTIADEDRPTGSIGVYTVETPKPGKLVKFATNATADDAEHFTSDMGYTVYYDEDDGCLYLSDGPVVPVARVTMINVTNEYVDINKAWANALDGTTDDPATLTLLTNITVTGELGMRDKTGVVTLDLNGCVLQAEQPEGGDNFRVLFVTTNGVLTVTDSQYGNPDLPRYFRPESYDPYTIWFPSDEETEYVVYGGAIIGGVADMGEDDDDGIAIKNLGGTLTIESGNIAGNANIGEGSETSTYDGGAIATSDGGTFTMTGGEICFNASAVSGGGIVIYEDNKSATIRGGKIHHNNSASGAGVFVGDGMSLTITGGEICSNVAVCVSGAEQSGSGGGIAVFFDKNIAHLNMEGGKIYDNVANGLGGGGILSFGDTTISGGEIYGNEASGEEGAGGGIVSVLYLTITGGDIYGNIATYGGGGIANAGMSTDFAATVTMTGGNVYGNTCEMGAGILNYAGKDEEGGVCPAALIMTGGAVTNNLGPAVVQSGTSMTVGGSAIIAGVAEYEVPGLVLPSGKTVTITNDPAFAEGAYIGVYTMDTPEPGKLVKFATNATEDDAPYFTSEAGYDVYYNSGNLYLSAGPVIPVATVKLESGEAVEFVDIETAWDAACAGTTDDPATLTLLTNVTTTSTLIMGEDVVMTLDLNNCVLQAQQTAEDPEQMFGVIESSGDLTVVDNGTGEKTPHYFQLVKDPFVGVYDLWVMTDEPTEYVVYGGLITGGITGGADGSAINSSGVLTIEGGALAGNNAIGIGADGGAIYASAGTFNMTGGEVAFNTALISGGGIGLYADSVSEISGGKIHHNRAASGGGVVMIGDDGEPQLTVSGGEICSNAAVYVSGTSLPTGTGGGITVYTQNNVPRLFVTGGQIYDNDANGIGGGAIANMGYTVLSGGQIYGNTASGEGEGQGVGGGVANVGVMAIEGGDIYGNTANYGAGVASFGGLSPASVELTMTGGAITNNNGMAFFQLESTLTLGGTPVIAGVAESMAPGLVLPEGTAVTLGEVSALGEGAYIGVYTMVTPTEEAPAVLIATGATEDDAQYFHSDMGYDVFYADGNIYLGSEPPKAHNITIDPASITGGTVTASAETALQGETITLWTTPESPQHILSSLRVLCDNTHDEVIPRSGSVPGEFTFTMPDDDVTVLATFKERHTISTVVVEGVGGELSSELDEATQGTLVLLKVTPDFTPEKPYRLAKLCYTNETTGAEVSITNNLFYMPDAPVTVYATFETPTPIFDIWTHVDPETGGTLTTDPTQATQGTTVSLSVVPAPNYRLVSLTCFTTNETPVKVTIVDNKFTMPFSAVDVTATFELVGPPPGAIQVGEDAWASIENNTCTITGTTAMWDLESGGSNPLATYKATITNLVVQGGVTRVGSRFFHKFRKIKAVTLASSVTSLGTNAFLRCESIDTIAFGALQEAVTLEESSIHYYLAITRDGEPYTVPTVTYAGEAAAMLGKEKLDDPEWEPVEPEPEKVFHFFKLAPMK